MSILYNFRKMPPRPDQNEPEEAEERLFAQAIIQRQYTTEDLCRDISDRSSFSSGDITGLMIAMEELIFEYLASGYSFRLGNIGTLSAKVKSRGVRDKKEIHANAGLERLELRGETNGIRATSRSPLTGTRARGTAEPR